MGQRPFSTVAEYLAAPAPGRGGLPSVRELRERELLVGRARVGPEPATGVQVAVLHLDEAARAAEAQAKGAPAAADGR